MTRPIRTLAAVLSVLVLAACGGDASSPSSGPADASATPDAGSTDPSPTDAPATAVPTSTPTDRGESAFSCDLPVVDGGTAPIANIVDVRVGTHDGYDRLVFEFAQGTPEFSLERAEPPFAADGSGMPIEVEGEAFLGLTMRGGTRQTDAGTSSYDGPTEFRTGFPMLVHAVEGGDFERQSTWYLGLTADACVRVLLLDEPPRLVIDVER